MKLVLLFHACPSTNSAIQQRKFNMGHNLESNYYLSRIYKAVLKHEINVAIKIVPQFCDTAI